MQPQRTRRTQRKKIKRPEDLYKQDSVTPCGAMNIHLSDATQRKTQRAAAECRGCLHSSLNLVLHRPRFTKPPRLPATLVGSYPTVSPLPFPPPEGGEAGGLLSVALSLGRPRLSLTADLLYGVPTFLPSTFARRASYGETSVHPAIFRPLILLPFSPADV